MQIRITDLMDDNCPTEISLGREDKAMARRINAAVMEKIGQAQPKPRRVGRKTLRTLLLAAAIAALMGTAAYATSAFFMKTEKTEEAVSGSWRAVDAEGKLTQDQKLEYPDAGMVLTFEGPEEIPNQPEFRCFYLPSGANFGFTDKEGWATYLSDNGQGAEIPYIISARAVRPGNFKTVINGEVTLVKEEDWGEWHVTELTSDYTDCTWPWVYEQASFALLFNGEKGWLVEITGTDDLETLEHIARELEIRDSGKLPYFAESEETAVEGIGMIDPGRG